MKSGKQHNFLISLQAIYRFQLATSFPSGKDEATFAEISPMTTSNEEFFEEPLEQSRVKARIVSAYVITFSRILSDYQRSAGKSPVVDYIDLFSGPGSYGDGTASTSAS